MILINTLTKQPVVKGDILTSFRGEHYEVTGWRAPLHSGSTGRINVQGNYPYPCEFYPSVFNCEWEV